MYLILGPGMFIPSGANFKRDTVIMRAYDVCLAEVQRIGVMDRPLLTFGKERPMAGIVISESDVSKKTLFPNSKVVTPTFNVGAPTFNKIMLFFGVPICKNFPCWCTNVL